MKSHICDKRIVTRRFRHLQSLNKSMFEVTETDFRKTADRREDWRQMNANFRNRPGT